MSAYIKFVCDYCGEREIEFEADAGDIDSIESARSLLGEYRWDTFDGYMCRSCDV